jgi:hypothetical protein
MCNNEFDVTLCAQACTTISAPTLFNTSTSLQAQGLGSTVLQPQCLSPHHNSGPCCPAATKPIISSHSRCPIPSVYALWFGSRRVLPAPRTFPSLPPHFPAHSICWEPDAHRSVRLDKSPFSKRLIECLPTYSSFSSFPCGSLELSDSNAGPRRECYARNTAHSAVQDRKALGADATPSRDGDMPLSGSPAGRKSTT